MPLSISGNGVLTRRSKRPLLSNIIAVSATVKERAKIHSCGLSFAAHEAERASSLQSEEIAAAVTSVPFENKKDSRAKESR